MSKERNRRAIQIFDDVCDLAPDQQATAVAAACGSDDVLHAAVIRLLNHDAAKRTNLVRGMGAEILASDVLGVTAANAPKQIGRYRIIREIGHGGMGIVYEAEQDAPKRLVALKVIRAINLSPQLIRRFEHEAYVLGQLQHPGIAHIYESGVVELYGQSQPYIAMELIRGERIHDFARRRSLTLRQKLELMARVCDAIQHAHQNGIIHRDLKPANILVVEHGTGTMNLNDSTHTGSISDLIGQPKVLDFGIARITNEDPQAVTMQTDTGQMVGTLAFMSPEQIEGDSRQLDTRCDVYALGVIMFQLLSKNLPFDFTGKSIADVARMIRDDEPTRLSSIIKACPGDIETIVRKALEKFPKRRYQSAAELAEDLRRFLGNQPINARPASVTYQLRKFAHRNRTLVGGVVATVAALVIGLISTSYFLAEALRQRDQAEFERARTAEVAEFQAELLEGMNARSFGRDIKKDLRQEFRQALDASGMDEATIATEYASFKKALRQVNGTNLARSILSGTLAERALERIEGGATKDPVTEARLRYALGKLYGRLGMYPEALAQHEQAVALRRDHLAFDHPETLRAMNHAGLMLREMGRIAEAEAILQETLTLRRLVLGNDHHETLTSLYNFASLLRYKGELEAAKPMLQEVVERTERLMGTDHSSSLSRRNTYCVVLLDLGRTDEALRCIRAVHDARQRVSGPDHHRTINTRNNLMAALFKSNRLQEAEPIAREVLSSSRRVNGDDHPTTSLARNNLGVVLLQLSQLDEAETHFRDAHDSCRASLNPEHEVSMKSTGNLIDALLKLGREEEAEPLCHSLIAVRRRLDPPKPGLVAQTLEKLGISHFQQQRFEEARDAWQECVDLRAGISNDHWLTQRARSRLGEALTELKEFQFAEQLLLESHAALVAQQNAIPLVAGADCVENAIKRIEKLYRKWGKLKHAERWK